MDQDLKSALVGAGLMLGGLGLIASFRLTRVSTLQQIEIERLKRELAQRIALEPGAGQAPR